MFGLAILIQNAQQHNVNPFCVSKQAPKYEPQLQMIQMTNDNDYIYIDFKNFKYDSKWEFPRENLELGMYEKWYLHRAGGSTRTQRRGVKKKW